MPLRHAPDTDFYAMLGLDRRCKTAQIKTAYRVLAKRYHPDLHGDDEEAGERQAQLNAAYETLSDPARRRAYDEELAMHEDDAFTSHSNASASEDTPARGRQPAIKEDLQVRLEDFFTGARLRISIHDPANPNGAENYPVVILPNTAPGERLRIERAEPFAGSHIIVRLKVRPHARFKVRGSDLRLDHNISAQTAARGGSEMIAGPSGRLVKLLIPAGTARDAVLRVAGEGLPKSGGRQGDLLVRVRYRIAVTSSASE